MAVLAHRKDGPLRQLYESAGVPIFTISDFPSFHEMVSAASGWKSDIVHIHRSGYPNKLESELLESLKSPRTRIVETNVFARFDNTNTGAIIDAHCLLSQWCAYKWTRWAGRHANEKRIYIVPNPVEPSRFTRLSTTDRNRIRSELAIPPNRFLFGRVGQPLAAKWSPAIFDAFQRVLTSGRDIGLLLVGAPPAYLNLIRRLPQEVRERIVVKPVTSNDAELGEMFGIMDGFLHASHIGESFGMVLCEAMQAGVPVVTLSTPLKDNSQIEIVGHGKGGLIAPEKANLAHTMIRLMDDAVLRQQVRESGAEWVSSRFSPAAVAALLENIFSEVLNEAPQKGRAVTTLPSLPDGAAAAGTSWMRSLIFHLIHQPVIYHAYRQVRSLAATRT